MILTGGCDVEISTFTLDGSGSTTSAPVSNRLPPPAPPSAAIKRAMPPAQWTDGLCSAVERWQTDLRTRFEQLDQEVADADSLDETRDRFLGFWDEPSGTRMSYCAN